MENPLLHNAIESARLGFYDDARGLLLQIIRQDPNNALAWLWLAQTLDDPKRQADCLRQALRIEPDNPDALVGVEALRAGMPLPEPGGGVITEPGAEFPEPDDMFGWGALYTEETESAPEPEPEPLATADTFGWGEMYAEEPESAPEPKSEPELYTSDDTFGWGELYTGTPEPEVPVEKPAPVKAPAPFTAFVGVEEEAPSSEPQSSAPESAPAPEESFLQRARRLRTQGFAPPVEPVVSAAPAASAASAIEAPPPETEPASYEPEAEVEEESPAASARKFRIFDRRVLFSILGLIQLPILIGLLAWYFFLRGPSVFEPDDQYQPVAKTLLRPALRTCRALDLDDFASTETLGGELTVDTVFTGTHVVITETLVVPEGVRLLVYPGATLVFSRAASIDVYGTLYACGNETTPVTFTALDKTPGGWEGMRLYNPSDVTVLSHAVIEYAGERALYLLNSVPVVADVTIARGALFPVSFDGSVVPDLSKNVRLADNPVNGIEVRPGTLQVPNVVWPNNNLVYVVPGLLRVDEGAALDIQSGVIVKFWRAPLGQLPGIWVHGLLKAEGVTFTSLYDSAEDAGGVTYLEAVDPQPGDWGSLTFFESSAKSYLRDVVIRYAGRSRGAVAMQASSPELTRVTIAHAAGYPLSADANASPTLNTVTLTDNIGGAALEILGDVTIAGQEARVWERLGGDTPIVRVVHDTVTVGPDAQLTIHPGVVVKFAERSRIVVQGALLAVGGNNPEEQIILTSVHDAEYGGDTGGLPVPRAKRVWDGIVVDGADATLEFHNVLVRYAALTLVDASPKLYSSKIAFAPGVGLSMTPGSSPDLRDTRFEGNAVNGITVVTGTLDSELRWAQLGGVGDEQIVRILEGEVIVGPDAFLTIDPGVIIKAGPAGKLTVLGRLHVAGQAEQRVVFTSQNDDTVGGDTNHRLLNARAGDWPGLEIGTEGFARLAYVEIYYAQVGLTVRGEQLPVIETGRVHIAYGKRPLSCTARAQISAAFLFEENEIEVTRCPSP